MKAADLIGPGDPPVFERLNPSGKSRVLLVCDHASCAVPAALDNLGLPDDALRDHIGWDIGAAAVTRRMAELLDAPALLAGYSRLVIDCNRPAEAADQVPPVTDGVRVPANQSLSPADVAARRGAFFDPYHATIRETLDAMVAVGPVPAVAAIHSFTPVYGGVERPWHIGIPWIADDRMARALIAVLEREPGIVVGENEPYPFEPLSDYTIPEYGVKRGLPHVLVELRNDQIRDDAGAEAWATRLSSALREVLARPETQRIEHFPQDIYP